VANPAGEGALRLRVVEDHTQNQPPLDRTGVALRYLCAVLPMMFSASTWAATLSRTHGRLVPALVDLTLGLIGLVLMGWRRRWPWQIALATSLLTGYSDI